MLFPVLLGLAPHSKGAEMGRGTAQALGNIVCGLKNNRVNSLLPTQTAQRPSLKVVHALHLTVPTAVAIQGAPSLPPGSLLDGADILRAQPCATHHALLGPFFDSIFLSVIMQFILIPGTNSENMLPWKFPHFDRRIVNWPVRPHSPHRGHL